MSFLSNLSFFSTLPSVCGSLVFPSKSKDAGDAFSAAAISTDVREKFLKFLETASKLNPKLINRSDLKDRLSCLNQNYNIWKSHFMTFIDALCTGKVDDFKRSFGFEYLKNVEAHWPSFKDSSFENALNDVLDILNGQEETFVKLSVVKYDPINQGNDF